MAPTESVLVRLQLLGQQIFRRGTDAAAGGLRNLGDQAERLGGRMRSAMEPTASVGGALAAIGRGSVVAGAALGTAGGMATKMGLEFNSTMESNTVAFANFLGSTRRAQAYLEDLYEVAATTPFEFPELAGAARKFLAFGFTARQTTSLLGTVGDAVSGIGGGSEEIERLSMSLGQMQAKGKVQTEEVLQLAELGVPAFQILRRELGLTGDELTRRLADGSIKAGRGIAALQAGMAAQFRGSARAQGRTFQGQLSTFQDYANKALGDLTRPLFDWLRDTALPFLNRNMPAISGAVRGAFDTIGRAIETVAPKVLEVGRTVVEAFKPAQPFLANVLIPLVEGLALGVGATLVGAFRVAVPIVRFFASALGWIGERARPVRGVIRGVGVVVGAVLGGPILKGVSLLGRFGGVFRAIGAAARVARLPIQLVGGAVGVAGRVVGRVVGVFAGLAGRALPALRGGFERIVGFIRGLGGRFLGAGRGLMAKLVEGLKGAIGAGLAFVGDLGKQLANSVIQFLNDAIPNSIPVPRAPDIPLPDNPIPMLATGGSIRRAGLALVGERGPEVVALPAGASVYPSTASRAAVASRLPHLRPPVRDVAALANAGVNAGVERIQVPVAVYLNQRQIAEAMGEYVAARKARA